MFACLVPWLSLLPHAALQIHGANGYLLDQFWKDSSNTRTDGYGGSIEKQGRLMLEVTEAVAAAVGAERTGLRLSPFNSFLSAQDSVPRAIEKNVWLMQELDKRVPDLAYIHMVRGCWHIRQGQC
jgi:N-ethylmaleimide reductase